MFLCIQKAKERWFEKLHEWDKALKAYEEKNNKNPDDNNYLLGRLRCLEALGQWCVVTNNIIPIIVFVSLWCVFYRLFMQGGAA